MNRFTLVQPIIVNPNNYDNAASLISDVSIASVLGSLHAGLRMSWILLGQRKTVRRVKTDDKLDQIMNDSGVIRVGSAVACGVITYADFSQELEKSQVSHWRDIPFTDQSGDFFGDILINEDSEMSIGKSAAAAAHALVMHQNRTGEIPSPDDQVRVLFASEGDILQCPVIVEDNGLTEVTPGTVTCGFRK